MNNLIITANAFDKTLEVGSGNDSLSGSYGDNIRSWGLGDNEIIGIYGDWYTDWQITEWQVL